MSMSTPLAKWATSHLSALYSPPTGLAAAQISGALDAAFAPDAEIYLNHALVDRETFREYVSGERAAGGHGRTEVECKSEDLTETEADGASIVAGKMTLVHTHNFRIRAAPARNSTVIVFSANIPAQDSKKPDTTDRAALPDVGG
ncbi:hypothetical protein B0H10DRAFT_1025883 [Mycena sp. CBHHK59/15]|nr:hypothetical protein B0H10DRAFT_1025883 [Mycena sp. CBHHK59/15]